MNKTLMHNPSFRHKLEAFFLYLMA